MATEPTPMTPNHPGGLTSGEARRRLEEIGPNAMPDPAVHPAVRALAKLWARSPGCWKSRSCSS